MSILKNLQGNYLTDLGAGLLAGSGYSSMPVSFGQAFGMGLQNAQSGQQQRLQNQLFRERIEEERSQKKAINDLVSNPTILGTLADRVGMDPEVFASIAKASPKGILGTIMSPRAGGTSTMQEYAWANDPNISPEESARRQSFINAGRQGRNDALDFLIAQAKLESLKTKNEEEDLSGGAALKGAVDNLFTMGQLNEALSGKRMGVGTPFAGMVDTGRSILAAAEDATGAGVVDAEGARNINNQVDAFNAAANSLVTDLAAIDASSGGRTNFQLSLIRDSKPSTDKDTPVNAGLIADTLEKLLPRIRQGDVDIGRTPAEIEAFIEKQRDMSVTKEIQEGDVFLDAARNAAQRVGAREGRSARIQITPAEISKSDLKTLQSLAPMVSNMTKQQREALAKRLDELGVD